jgi:hypothetical protein
LQRSGSQLAPSDPSRSPQSVTRDIEERIERDFGAGALKGVVQLFEPIYAAGMGDRIVRCCLALSGGDLHRLRHNIVQALNDYRDVIYWAEYDANDGRIHDYNNPF